MPAYLAASQPLRLLLQLLCLLAALSLFLQQLLIELLVMLLLCQVFLGCCQRRRLGRLFSLLFLSQSSIGPAFGAALAARTTCLCFDMPAPRAALAANIAAA